MAKLTIMTGILSLFAVGMILSSPLTASFAAPQQQPNDYLDLEKTIVKIKQDPMTETNSIADIIYKIGGFLPEDEMVAPFGYGVVTAVTNETGGTELNVIATTSHAGLLDADAQEGDPNNPILHNHYAVLGSNANCGDRPSIDALSGEELGQVFVNGKTIIVKDLPSSAPDSTEQIEITPGTNIQFVASFLLEVEGPSTSPVVCVSLVEVQNDRAVIFGEQEEQKPDYPRPDYGNDYGYENNYHGEDEYGYENHYSMENSYDMEYN